MDEAVKQTEARPARSTALASWVARPEVLTGALVAFVLVLAVIRVWLAGKIATPWIMSDEFLYSELARSFADSHRLLVRGCGLSDLQRRLSATRFAGLACGVDGDHYTLVKTINVVLMTIALIPVYLWSLRLMRPVYAVVATALVALLPAFVYTGRS